jgi:hypothetical protein
MHKNKNKNTKSTSPFLNREVPTGHLPKKESFAVFPELTAAGRPHAPDAN